MTIAPRSIGLAVGFALAGLLIGGFLWQGPGSLVDWTGIRAVAIESDDWGLAGFVPRAEALDGLDRSALHPGAFPEVYWGSTLEDSAMVGHLARILAGVRGHDGLPAVLQPNYVMGSLEYLPGDDTPLWRQWRWPAVPPRYSRPGLAEAVASAVAEGVWYPEYHALFHYDPDVREAVVARDPVAAAAAGRGVLVFPGSQQAWELGPARDPGHREADLDQGIRSFQAAFGRPPGSIIAPDYTWDSQAEDLWLSRGQRVIQAKREQRMPGRGWGLGPRLAKLLQQRWEKLSHRDRIYLERNARFEPVQAPDPTLVADSCLREIRQAWRRGVPAIVEAHRVNFVHTDPLVVETGLEEFATLLDRLAAVNPGPVFMTDKEIASLARDGVSACRRGTSLVIHNRSHAARMVPLDSVGLPGRVCWMPAVSIRILDFVE